MLQVDAGDEEEVRLGQGLGLRRGHVVLVRRGVGGQQAGELEVGRGLGGIGTEMLGLTVRTGALEGEVAGGVSLSIASGKLGDVVADLGGGGDRLDRSRGVGRGRAVTTGSQGGSGQARQASAATLRRPVLGMVLIASSIVSGSRNFAS